MIWHILIFYNTILSKFSVCICTCTLWTHNHLQSGMFHHIICSSCTAEAENLLWVTEHQGPNSQAVYSRAQAELYEKSCDAKALFCGIYNAVKIYKSSTCEIACCVSKQYCSISLNTLIVFLLVLPICVCRYFLLGPSIFFHLYNFCCDSDTS